MSGEMDYFSDPLVRFLREENYRLGINVPVTTSLYRDNIASRNIVATNMDLIYALAGETHHLDQLIKHYNTHWIYRGYDFTHHLRHPGVIERVTVEEPEVVVNHIRNHIANADSSVFERGRAYFIRRGIQSTDDLVNFKDLAADFYRIDHEIVNDEMLVALVEAEDIERDAVVELNREVRRLLR
jgi:hypothetical protein